jgi:hypothetical protein
MYNDPSMAEVYILRNVFVYHHKFIGGMFFTKEMGYVAPKNGW